MLKVIVRSAFLASCCVAVMLTPALAEAGQFKKAPKNGVPDMYIVVLADGIARKPGGVGGPLPSVAQVGQDIGRAHGGHMEEVWEHALQAVVMRMPEARARKMAEDSRVIAVEQDFSISSPVGDCYFGTPLSNTRALPSSSTSPQTLSCSDPDPVNDPNRNDPSHPPLCVDNWGLDRIDQLGWARDSRHYFVNNGGTVHVYVMDTGIRSTHREFLNSSGTATRVSGGADALNNPAVPGTPLNTNDCYGHGTHVAGIIGGRTYGVAKNAILHPVRVIGCRGTSNTEFVSRVARGLDWIVANVQRPAVINWSGGNDTSFVNNVTLRTAVANVLNANIVLVQAAGNQSPDYNVSQPQNLRDACDWSFGGPYPGVIVAAGMDEYDGRWTRRPATDPDDDRYCGSDCGSNAGSCVDVWAPSSHVISSEMSGDDLACILSGTSMAAPHTAGVVAIYLQSNPTATVAQVERALRSRGTWGALQSNSGNANYIGNGSDNVLIHSDTRSMGSDLPPVASFTVNCPGRQCNFSAGGSSDDLAVTSHSWQFGDTTTATGSSVQHTFAANSTFQVTLQVTDGANHTDHIRQSVTVNADAPPVASFTYSCSGLVCSFDATASSDDQVISSRTWSFGDGGTGSGATASHTYASGGSFVVTLAVTDNAGQTATQQQTIAVDLAAPVNTAATASGSTATITWTPSSGADSYDLQRKVSSAAWAFVKNVPGGSSSFTTDVPPAPSGVVLYRVVARAASSQSAPSNNDVAFVGTFSNDGTPSPVPLRAEHLTEMRRAVNGLRDIAGLGPQYSSMEIDPNNVRMQAVDEAHWVTLMTNLNAARTAPLVGLNTVSFSVIPTQSGPVRPSQIAELRQGVK
jgi:hypothetical protein